MRAIGQSVGAHLYQQTDDLIHACSDLILVHAKEAGNKKITWHRKAPVLTDLYTGRTIANNSQSWSCQMKKHETKFMLASTHATTSKILAAIEDGNSYE